MRDAVAIADHVDADEDRRERGEPDRKCEVTKSRFRHGSFLSVLLDE